MTIAKWIAMAEAVLLLTCFSLSGLRFCFSFFSIAVIRYYGQHSMLKKEFIGDLLRAPEGWSPLPSCEGACQQIGSHGTRAVAENLLI